MDAAVRLNNISKKFKIHKVKLNTLKERIVLFNRERGHEEFWALKEVSIDIPKGTTFGLIGSNGSGKTTLLKLIAGILKPTSGEVLIDGRISALLELGAGFHPDLTGRENVFMNASILGLSKRDTAQRFDSIVQFAELEKFIDNPVRNYSSGMYVRLGFAVAVHMDPDILLVDEVLAVGDEAFQEKCLARIRQFQREERTIVFVTHGVDMVREMCDQAALLENGVVAAIGDPTEVVRAYRNKISTTPTGDKVQVLGNLDFKEIRLLDAQGKPSDALHAGGPMTVEVALAAHEPLPDPVFSVNIHDSAGVHVFGTNTHWRYLHAPLDPGPARLRIHFPILPMREGRFTLTVGAHSRDGLTLYATTDRAIKFNVESPTTEPGRLFLDCEFSVEGAVVKKEQADAG